jgi:hypothetical protein
MVFTQQEIQAVKESLIFYFLHQKEIVEIEETFVEIQASSWKGKDLSYLILFESGVEKWIKSSYCASIQGMVNEFHKQNPGAPNKTTTLSLIL